MAGENYDYATVLFSQCVLGDPENKAYVQGFLGNLQRKYGNNKKGATLAQFKEFGARTAMKKALAQSHWEDVLKHGLAVLKINPWDVATLTAMASAAEGIVPLYGGAEFSECQMLYLKTALEANSKDPEVNRLCGIALGKRRQFDQAIACWHRVEQARPDDEEPKRAIAGLAVEKTITSFDETDPAKISARRSGPVAAPRGVDGRGTAAAANRQGSAGHRGVRRVVSGLPRSEQVQGGRRGIEAGV